MNDKKNYPLKLTSKRSLSRKNNVYFLQYNILLIFFSLSTETMTISCLLFVGEERLVETRLYVW